MAKDLFGGFEPKRMPDEADGKTYDDADNADRCGANISEIFGNVGNDILLYLKGGQRNEGEGDKFLQYVRQGNIGKIKEMMSLEHVNKDEKYKMQRMQPKALQIASENGCFQMVHLFKKACGKLEIVGIYQAKDIDYEAVEQLPKMVARANPAYLCVNEDDPIKAAFMWPSEFKEIFGPTNTLHVLRERYKFCKRQLTTFLENLLHCCHTPTEVRTLLKGKCDKKSGIFLNDRLHLVYDAVKYEGKGFVAHRKTQVELQRQWLDGQPKWFRWGGSSWGLFLFYHLFFFLFYALSYPILPLVYLFPCCNGLISSPKGKFAGEFISSVFFLVALFFYEVFDVYHYIVYYFLLSWIVGSFLYELVQINIVGCRLYFTDIWNILDIIILISFAAGVIIKDFVDTGYHFVFFLEKLPALTLVCILLRRMQAFYLSALIGKMFLIFLEMRTEVFRFLVIFGYVVLVFASAFYFLYHRMRSGIFKPFSTFNSSLLHLTMTMFSGGGHIEFLQLLNHNVTRVNALSNGTHVIDNSNIYDIIGFTLYMVFLTMAIFILLKLCGAMMTNKYSILDERIVREWYFKRSEIWLLFIRQKIIFPPPHNILEIIFRTLLGLKRCIQSALYRRCKIDTNRKDEERIQMADGREDFIPSYEQLITILKIRYYREYGRKNCRIHGLCEDKTHV